MPLNPPRLEIDYKENLEQPLWWLSFATDKRCLGVVITHAPSFMIATLKVSLLGLNPGGSIRGHGPMPENWIPSEYWNRLLTPEEAKAIPEPASVKEMYRWEDENTDF